MDVLDADDWFARSISERSGKLVLKQSLSVRVGLSSKFAQQAMVYRVVEEPFKAVKVISVVENLSILGWGWLARMYRSRPRQVWLGMSLYRSSSRSGGSRAR